MFIEVNYNNPVNYINVSNLKYLYKIYYKIETIAKKTYNEYKISEEKWLRSKNTQQYFIATKKFLLKIINLTIVRQKLMDEILYKKTNNSNNQTYDETNYYNYQYNYNELQNYPERYNYNKIEYLKQAYEYIKNTTNIEELRMNYGELKQLIDRINTDFTIFSYNILIEIYIEVANKYNLTNIVRQLDNLMMEINTGKAKDIHFIYQMLEQIRSEIIKQGVVNE